MAANNMSGLNVATKAGEGSAHIAHFEQLNQTLNKLYDQDLSNFNYLRNNYDKSAMMLAKSEEGIRPADQAKAQELYNKWRESELTMMSPKIRNNPQERARYAQQSQDAEIAFMNWTKRSKQFVKDYHDLNEKMATAKGVGYLPQNEMKSVQDRVERMTVDELESGHYNTPIPYLLRASTAPKKNYEKEILGTYYQGKKGPIETVTDESGKVMGTKETTRNFYSNWDPENPNSSPWTIANTALAKANEDESFAGELKIEYQQALDTNPDGVKQMYENTSKYMGSRFSELADDWHKYAMAKYVNKAAPTKLEAGPMKYDKEYEARQNQIRKFLFAEKQNELIKGRMSYSSRLREGVQIRKEQRTGGVLPDQEYRRTYDAMQNPNKLYEVGKDAKGKPIFASGYDITKGMQAAVSYGNPEKPESFVLNDKSLFDKKSRSNIASSLFADDPSFLNNLDAFTMGNEHLYRQAIVAKLRDKYNTDLTEDDISSRSVLVYKTTKLVRKQDGSFEEVPTVKFVNPRTDDYGTAKSKISQQMTKNKKNVQQSFGENYWDAINH